MAQEPIETEEGSGKERARQGLNDGRGVPPLSQLNQAQDEGRRKLKRRARKSLSEPG